MERWQAIEQIAGEVAAEARKEGDPQQFIKAAMAYWTLAKELQKLDRPPNDVVAAFFQATGIAQECEAPEAKEIAAEAYLELYYYIHKRIGCDPVALQVLDAAAEQAAAAGTPRGRQVSDLLRTLPRG